MVTLPFPPLPPGRTSPGYMVIMLMIAFTVMSIGLLVAVPVWQTQLQREREEELIFRGNQYVEAIRLYQARYPGRFPNSLEDLYQARCLRRLYKEPMGETREWDLILPGGIPGGGQASATQKVLIVPSSLLPTLNDPQIIGVVSPSNKNSIKIYNGNSSYDTWLFYYGQDPRSRPEIIRFGIPPQTR